MGQADTATRFNGTIIRPDFAQREAAELAARTKAVMFVERTILFTKQEDEDLAKRLAEFNAKLKAAGKPPTDFQTFLRRGIVRAGCEAFDLQNAAEERAQRRVLLPEEVTRRP